VLLLAVSAAAGAGILTGVTDLGALRADGLATLAYVANWHQLLAGEPYFARFAAPSPLAHTWSLAIEEQFYVVWPLLVGGSLWAGARWRRAGRVRPGLAPLGALTAVGALASASWMGWLAAHGASADRLYYGTDTRAFELLGGAALAIAVAGRPVPAGVRRAALHAASVVGLVTMAALIVPLAALAAAPPGSTSPARWMFQGGMALFCAAALAVVAAAGWLGTGPVTAMLRFAPLRFAGRISYALYLWHWPVVTQLTPSRTGLGGPALVTVRLAVAVGLAVASTLLLEEPIRRRIGAGRIAGASTDRWPLPQTSPARRQRARSRPPLARRDTTLAAAAVVAVALCIVVGTANVGVVAAGAAELGPFSGSGVPGSSALASEPPLQLPGMAPPTPMHPLRVTLLGDSVMLGQAPAAIAALQATGAATVTDMAYPGWGLSTDHSWPIAEPAMLARTRPELVVAMWSWDGDWALADPADYRLVLERFLTLLLAPPGGAPGARAVVLEEFPPLGPLPVVSGDPAGAARRVAGVQAWNALASAMPARFPGKVLYLPLGPAVERSGGYATWLRSAQHHWVRVRSVDATHFCPAGAARYSAAMLADLRTEVALPAPRPGWWSGPWQRAAVFRTPAGTCPADRPG
jgi:peptidoglycan/LPS O-acetylase OafA/YrhL